MKDLKFKDLVIPVLYEDDYCLVINKPPNLVVNDSVTVKENVTLQQVLKDKNFIDQESENKEYVSREGIIHRLDKDTSGVMVVAKDAEFFSKLQAQFKSRDVKKTYYALCYMDHKFQDDHFVIDAPIGRSPKNRMRYAIDQENGRSAVTEFEVIERFTEYKDDAFVLMKCNPRSGRTHQIRVHLTAFGCAIAGDSTYGGPKRLMKYAHLFKRQMLHAYSLEFEHPITNEMVSITAPLPSDMESVLEFFRGEK